MVSKRAKVLVVADQLSIAIGRGGQNVRLASRLTGYELDIEPANGGAAVKAAPVEAGKPPRGGKKNIEDSLLAAIEESSEEPGQKDK